MKLEITAEKSTNEKYNLKIIILTQSLTLLLPTEQEVNTMYGVYYMAKRKNQIR